MIIIIICNVKICINNNNENDIINVYMCVM